MTVVIDLAEYRARKAAAEPKPITLSGTISEMLSGESMADKLLAEARSYPHAPSPQLR